MELDRFDHTKEIDCANENTLNQTRRLLMDVHGAVLGLISACEDYRFEVVEGDTWFFRLTGGGGLTKLEDELIDIRDWSQEAYVNVRKALDRIESIPSPEDEQ